MKLQGLTVGAVAVSLALGLGACSSSQSAKEPEKNAESGTIRMWVMQGSLSDESQKILKEKFAKDNPGSKLEIEVQQWDGIIAKLQTSLASKTESPDLVEIGNTQVSTFTTVGAFEDVTDMKEELGGADLIPSFVEAGSVGDKIYAYPLYAGARGVFYRKDLMEKAGIPEPKTISEFREAAIKLQQANPEGKPNFSGIYLAAVDAHGVESYLFSDGFDYAKLNGDKWEGLAATPQSLTALKNLQEMFKNATRFGLDSRSGQKTFEKYFNDGQVGMLIATGNVGTKIDKKLWDDGKVAVMAVPSETAGVPGKVFAGGSSIAIGVNAKNKPLAKKALKSVFSKEFQEQIAADGWVPGNTKFGSAITGPFSQIALEAVKNSKLTPNTPQWGVAVGDNMINDFYTRLAKGEDVESTAKKFNEDLTKALNGK